MGEESRNTRCQKKASLPRRPGSWSSCKVVSDHKLGCLALFGAVFSTSVTWVPTEWWPLSHAVNIFYNPCRCISHRCWHTRSLLEKKKKKRKIRDWAKSPIPTFSVLLTPSQSLLSAGVFLFCFLFLFFFFFSSNNFIKVKFINHAIHPCKVCNLRVFGIYMDLCNHHYSQF